MSSTIKVEDVRAPVREWSQPCGKDIQIVGYIGSQATFLLQKEPDGWQVKKCTAPSGSIQGSWHVLELSRRCFEIALAVDAKLLKVGYVEEFQAKPLFLEG